MSEQRETSNQKMPGSFDKYYSAIIDVGNILEKHYGEEPADIIALHFSDAKSKKKLRDALYDQSSYVLDFVQDHEKLTTPVHARNYSRNFFVHYSTWEILQERLNNDGILVHPFMNRVKDYPELSKQEYYENVIRLLYTLAEFADECQGISEQFAQKQRDQAAVDELVNNPDVSDDLRHNTLKCDFPEPYLEWIAQQSSRE